MVHHWSILFLIFLLLPAAYAQDERYYRQILTGELREPDSGEDQKMVSRFNVTGASYRVDLNGDKIEEIILPQKRDGVDWLEIQNTSKSKIFETKLLAMGSWSEIYKIKLVQISDTAKALIVFLDEGKTAGRRFESTARFFVLAYEKNNLEQIVVTEGPHFFHERQAPRDQYWRRTYNVNVFDINGDGVREIAVQYNHIQRIMQYSGRGEWKRL